MNMVPWTWLARLLLLACLAKVSICLHFFPESEGMTVSRTEAEDFFNRLDERIAKRKLEAATLNNFTYSKRDNIFRGLGLGFGNNPANKNVKRTESCLTPTADGTDIDTSRRECRWSVNKVLQNQGFSSLETLSANILNGENFVVTGRVGDKLMAKHRVTSGKSKLPAMVLDHSEPVTIELDLNPAAEEDTGKAKKKSKSKKSRKRREARSTKKAGKEKIKQYNYGNQGNRANRNGNRQGQQNRQRNQHRQGQQNRQGNQYRQGQQNRQRNQYRQGQQHRQGQQFRQGSQYRQGQQQGYPAFDWQAAQRQRAQIDRQRQEAERRRTEQLRIEAAQRDYERQLREQRERQAQAERLQRIRDEENRRRAQQTQQQYNQQFRGQQTQIYSHQTNRQQQRQRQSSYSSSSYRPPSNPSNFRSSPPRLNHVPVSQSRFASGNTYDSRTINTQPRSNPQPPRSWSRWTRPSQTGNSFSRPAQSSGYSPPGQTSNGRPAQSPSSYSSYQSRSSSSQSSYSSRDPSPQRAASQPSSLPRSTPRAEPPRSSYSQQQVQELPLSTGGRADFAGISKLSSNMGSSTQGAARKRPDQKTVEDVAITVNAKGWMNLGNSENGFGPRQSLTVTKKLNDDSYGINYGIPQDISQLAGKVSTFMGQIASYTDYLPPEITDFATKVNDYASKVTSEADQWKITGAFDKDKNYQISLSRADTNINNHQISKLTFIISMDAEETSIRNAGYTFFANFVTESGGADLAAMLSSAFSGSTILTTLLDSIKSEKWCVLVASKNTTYINTVMDDVMTNCLGDGETSALKEADTASQYSTSEEEVKFEDTGVIKGLHFYAKADFKGLLDKCWELPESGAKPAHFTDIDTVFAIYSSITRAGMTFRLPGGSEEIGTFAKSCMVGLLVGAPQYLTESQIKIDTFEYEKNPPVFKIGVIVEPSEANRYLPGTKLGLNSLKVVLNRKTSGRTVTWDVTGETEIVLNEMTATVSVVKEDSQYTIGVSIDTFRLSDITEGFNVQEYPDIMKTLGVKDFNLAVTYEKGQDFSVEVTGKPLIVNYDDLSVNVMCKGSAGRLSEWSVGLYMNGANFDDLMKRIAGNEKMSLKWLDSLKAVVVFAVNKDGKLQAASRKRSLLAAPSNSTSAEWGSSASNTTAAVEKEEASLVPRTKRDALPNPDPRYNSGGYGNRNRQGSGHSSRAPPSSSSPSASSSPSDDSDSSGDSESSDDSEDEGNVIEFADLAEPFQDMKFVQGLTFGVSWEIPNDKNVCEDNGICIWLVENIGKKPKQTEEDQKASHLMISGEVTSTWFTLKASLITEILLINKKNSKLALNEIALIIEVGTSTPKFMIEAQMSYEDANIGATGGNVLNFVGTIEATPISIQMTFSMEGYVFPSDYLAIGNVKLGIGYSFVTGLPTMMFGASIMFGKLKKSGTGTAEEFNSNAIIVKGYFGINPGNPTKNFLYGSINKLTMAAVCDAFELSCDSVPKQLKDTGFPSGITASYAGEKTTIPGIGDVEQGIFIKGTLNFLGLEAYCELGKEDRTWRILIEMSPINWADGWIQVLRSDKEEDADKGPKVEAAFGGGESELKIEGYVNALNYIKAKVNITITSTKLNFFISTFIVPNLIEASIEFMINYDTANDNGDDRFKFEATVSTNGMVTKLKEAIKEFIDTMAKRAKEVIEEARKIVKAVGAKVEAAKAKVREWEQSIEQWKESLRQKKKALQEEANRTPPCECPLVCLPFLDWDPKCWKVWGYWVGCPFLNSCFTKIKDPFCLANCALKKVISALTRWAKQAVLSITMLIADGAKGLLGLSKGVFAIADKILETANKAVDWVVEKVGELAEWAKGKVEDLFSAFALEYLKLNARLTADYSPCVGFDIKLIIKRETYERSGEVCLDVKSFLKAFVRLILDDTDKSTSKLTEESESLDEAEKKNSATKAAEGELEEEEQKTQNKINEEQAKKFDREAASAAKRDDLAGLHKWKPFLEKIPKVPTVRTAEEMEMINLANAPVDKYYAEDDEDPHVRSIIEHGAWAQLHHKQSVGASATVIHDGTVKEKRSLDFDEHMTPCERMKRALTGYSDLTDGMITYVKRIQDTGSGLENFEKERFEKLRNLRNKIEAADMKHNMSIDDREQAYFLYNKLSKDHADMVKRSNIAIAREDSYALPVIRRQINSLLKKANGKNFMEFTELMHANAVQGYKRSRIPHPSDAEGEKMLSKIKKDIQSIITDEDSNITPMSSRLGDVKKSIIAMGSYTKTCNKA